MRGAGRQLFFAAGNEHYEKQHYPKRTANQKSINKAQVVKHGSFLLSKSKMSI